MHNTKTFVELKVHVYLWLLGKRSSGGGTIKFGMKVLKSNNYTGHFAKMFGLYSVVIPRCPELNVYNL